MTVLRITERQKNAIKNFMFSVQNIQLVLDFMLQHGKTFISELSVDETNDLISAMVAINTTIPRTVRRQLNMIRTLMFATYNMRSVLDFMIQYKRENLADLSPAEADNLILLLVGRLFWTWEKDGAGKCVRVLKEHSTEQLRAETAMAIRRLRGENT